MGIMNTLLHNNSETSYFLGALLGDGFVGYYENRHQYPIGLSVKDKEFVEEFNKCASIALGMKPKEIKQYNKMYRVTFYSKDFAFLLKNKPWEKFIHIYEKYPAEFIKGFFDADGCAQKDGNVYISNTNKDVILYIQDLLLRNFNIRSNITTAKIKIESINGRKLKSHKPFLYHLYLIGNFSKMKFGEKIGSSISRKKERFRERKQEYEDVGKLHPKHRCKCGRQFEYNVEQNIFRELMIEERAVLKIRCSNLTKETFKKLKQKNELPSYESLLQMLMSLSGL